MTPRSDTRFFIRNQEIRPTSEFPSELFSVEKSVYEVVKIFEGNPVFFKEHFERFTNSLHIFGFESDSPDFDHFSRQVDQLFKVNNLKSGNLRIDFFPRSLTTIFYVIPHFYPPENFYAKGVKVVEMNYCRENPNAKIQNNDLKTQAANLMKTEDAFEVVLVNDHGIITEGSRTNVFFVRDETLYTAPENLVLKGISAKKVKEICHALGLQIIEKELFAGEAASFGAMFITGTSIGVLPVSAMGQIKYDVGNTVLQALVSKFKMIERNCEL